jgi:hypothetical protein
MIHLSEEVLYFFRKQGFTLVSTLNGDGTIHVACKDIVRVTEDGKIYLLDLYMGRTYRNLKERPVISVTAADEHTFTGYCLKGKPKIIPREELGPKILNEWDKTITSRVTSRLLRNIRGEKGHSAHPEALLPKPKYMIMVEVDEVIDLTPKHLKKA